MEQKSNMQCNIKEQPSDRESEELEQEKVDLSPENSKKSDNSPADDTFSKLAADADNGEKLQCMTGTLYDGESASYSAKSSSSKREIENNACDDIEVRNALAFTIDFGDGRKQVDQQRHEKMLERFQNRHRRGVSLSKLETQSASSSTTIRPPQTANLPRKHQQPLSNEQVEVKLRDKSTSSRAARNSRHSWSPRTSITDVATKVSSKQTKALNKFAPKSTTLQMAFEQQHISCSSSEQNAESMDSSIGIHCSQPPLENFNSEKDDSVSEAGTYTLDGDNYTEEQKERMNIDRIPVSSTHESNQKSLFTIESVPSIPKRPTNFQEELEVIDLDQAYFDNQPATRKKPNVLEVDLAHESTLSTTHKPKQSYLEKLKTRVRNITHKHKSYEGNVVKEVKASPDQGTFTSVTTSGILSIKPSLESHPRLQRRNSLTKAHIDSSEYVEGRANLNIHRKNDEPKILNCYTDSEKAIEKINYRSSNVNQPVDSSTISSAVSKKDWIQEWAKNAREYSRHTDDANLADSAMTQSYNFEKKNQFGYDYNIDMTKSDYYDSKKYDQLEDNMNKYHLSKKQRDLLFNNTSNSEPTIQQDYVGYGGDDKNFIRCGSLRQSGKIGASKPPMSPSKIPSPVCSTGRARSVSRNRSLQGSNSDISMNETEMYLHKTAAAISTLQNLHRRNSQRSASLHNSSHSSPMSPASRHMSPKISPMNSLRSPIRPVNAFDVDCQIYPRQHQSLLSRQQQNPMLNHRRNLSFDNSDYYENMLSGMNDQLANSYDTQQLNAMLEFKKHTRHNSFEGITTLPPKPLKCSQKLGISTTIGRDIQIQPGNSIEYDDDDDDNILVVSTDLRNMSLGAKKEDFSTRKKQAPISKIEPVPKGLAASAIDTAHNSSPIKRSSSFSVKSLKGITPTHTPKMSTKKQVGNVQIQKSASSTSFKKLVTDYNTYDNDLYINNDDDLELDNDLSSNSELSDKEEAAAKSEKQSITNTRGNKTFQMRVEQNRKIAMAGKQGAAACPNTPEPPRRALNIKGAVRDRSSMPRDSSLNRMKQDMTMSRKSVTKELVSKEPASKTKVQPKYMDISKYKTNNSANFLKKDETKSYLFKPDLKKSPSTSSVSMARADPNRISVRSVKSAGPKPGKKEAPKAKEQELEMWRRRASYDPMKAAMEGKRKQEEAKRAAQQQVDRLKTVESSVLRSKSYHSGVGAGGMSRVCDSTVGDCEFMDNISSSSQPSNRWTLTSNESSDELDDEH
ncbi:uncharacterized protein LOC129742309 [Uranotaenia lowii]|uniref:uncharacterized protein LOC129742309 n=1 Tax=Uranotaenia lowii TaxID=190385 RepID=UPI0024792A5E|nr:uncharacterized protein LOC129742309 [Uranotaenia lowii]